MTAEDSLTIPFSEASRQGWTLAAEQLRELLKPGDWIALSGTLGAGKTTLVRHFLETLGFKDPVTSPTYPILLTYEGTQKNQPWELVHIDGYRLSDYRQIPWDAAEFSNAYVFIEWPSQLLLGAADFDFWLEIQILPDQSRVLSGFRRISNPAT